MQDIIVIGAGPAGMMAAVKAAEGGAKVTLLEKMERVGKKLLITGKGRCNITNASPIVEIIKNIPGNGAFLNSVFNRFDNNDVVDFFHELGVMTKVERGGRVFPQSDKASDVVDALLFRMIELGVNVKTKAVAKSVKAEDDGVCGVYLDNDEFLPADYVIVATGGVSYPKTGSDGDGHRMAKELGHTIVELTPSLVPLETEEDWAKTAQGLSLKNVRVTLFVEGKKVASEFGEMMFTHFGVTGPIILSLSRMAAMAVSKGNFVELELSLKPALTPEVLHERLRREFGNAPNKSIKNVMRELLPEKLILPILDLAYIEEERKVNTITREERVRILELLQHLSLTVTKARPIEEAIVTAGGISVKEINPRTMESKLVKGLYFIGEILDIDGFTGGFNLQAAFSMGAGAATSILNNFSRSEGYE